MTYTQPLLLASFTIILIGLLRLRHSKGVWLPLAGMLALLLFAWPPVDWLLSRPLENRYSKRPFQAKPTEAIVVLAAGVTPARNYRPFAVPDEETFERCEFAAWLYKNWQGVPVLASGGPGRSGARPFASTMRELLLQSGVPTDMIWTEEHSQSTHENALYSAEILRQHGVHNIALVVEAQSMPRAEATFRKQGLFVVPAPSEFRHFGSLADELIPSWRAIQRNEITLHEVLGLAWYWLHSWV